MDDIRDRLHQDLNSAVTRLHQLGGIVAVLPGAAGGHTPFADEVDTIQAEASREVGLTARALLVERVHRLSAALERLGRGDYGLCAECVEPIAPARLRAVPEVQTCVRCQDAIERLERREAHSDRAYSPLVHTA